MTSIRNTFQRVKLLDNDPEQKTVRIKFLESNIIMPIAKDLLEKKVENGFYKLVDGFYLK